jgi:hypothetical protein
MISKVFQEVIKLKKTQKEQITHVNYQHRPTPTPTPTPTQTCFIYAYVIITWHAAKSLLVRDKHLFVQVPWHKH